jgi:hypothetical protein
LPLVHQLRPFIPAICLQPLLLHCTHTFIFHLSTHGHTNTALMYAQLHRILHAVVITCSQGSSTEQTPSLKLSCCGSNVSNRVPAAQLHMLMLCA